MKVNLSVQEFSYYKNLKGERVYDKEEVKTIRSIEISNGVNQIKLKFTDGSFSIRPKNRSIEFELDEYESSETQEKDNIITKRMKQLFNYLKK